MQFFRKIYVNVNTACNYRCTNCLLLSTERNKKKNSLLSLADLKKAMAKLIPDISDEVSNICEVSGGEPTIHHQFKGISNYLSSLKNNSIFYKMVLLSNCHNLDNRKKAEEISSYFNDVVTAIYTPIAREHDNITGVNDSLAKKLNAIELLVDLGVKVHIKTLVIKPSFQLLPNIARMICGKFHEKIHLTINATHFIGDAKINQSNLATRLSGAVPYIEEAIDIAESEGSSVGFFLPLCLLDPIYWKFASLEYADQVKRTFAITPESKSFNKAKNLEKEFVERHNLCKDCHVRIRCNWPWRSYVDIFGDSEIVQGKQNLIFDERR